ncbi:MAG: peptidase domain-containing ABC transporter [Kofleriaceae bacterium]
MSESKSQGPSLVERFPALARLGFSGGARTIPFVQQLQWTDCGAASLAMVMAYHGKVAKLAEIRDAMGIGRDGVTAKAILETADRFGLQGRAIKVDIEQLPMLPRGCVLHWELNHFVVFDRLVKGGVRIVDPAVGPRDVKLADFRKQFTGVALDLSPTARFTKQKAEKGRLGRYVTELLSERTIFTRVIVMSMVLRLVALVLPLLTGMIIDKVVPRADYSLLYVVLASIGGMVAFNTIIGIIRAHLMLHLRMALDTRMTLSFLDHMVSLPFSFFQKRSTGDLMQRVDSNGTVREIVTSKSMSAVIDGFFVLTYAIIIFWVNPLLGVIAITLSMTEALVFLAARPANHRLLAASLDKAAKEHGYMIQMLGGMETLKCAGAEQLAVEKWSNLYTDQLNVTISRVRMQAYVDAVRGAIASLAPLLILTVGATAVMKGKMSLGTMLAMNSLASSLFDPLSALVSSALELQLVRGHMERIDDVLQTQLEQDRDKVVQPPVLRGNITVRDVKFRYGEQAPLVVDGVDLDIPAGAAVALVGPSGSGKTTLLSLLAGLHQPVGGEIAYDGKPLKDMDLRAVRQQIGIVPQHPYIFGASIRENIALTVPQATLDRIASAARVGCLHDDIVAMQMGYDTIVSDGGGSLSGGQRQRVAIARAVLRNPSIMLLDEATSALDNKIEANVIANLEKLRCTRITVAHRLSTVRNADLIVVMDKGKVVEQGTHAQLVAARGLYHALLRATEHPDQEDLHVAHR